MSEFKRIAIDTSKHVFTLHGVDAAEQPTLRKTLRRSQMEAFFARLPPTEIVLEACGGSHHWGRLLQALGHRVRLIPPQYVKPFVKRSKNDSHDAEAISEAAARPTMRSVPVKSATQQADASLLSVRELLVRQRTQLVNALRGHAAEFGLIAPQGPKGLTSLLASSAEAADLPQGIRDALRELAVAIAEKDAQLTRVEATLMAAHRANAVSCRLAAIPGIGPIGALTLVARVDATQFRSGRHLAAWMGLTPREHSTGGKQRLGGISRAGDERLRQLLVLGATSVIRHMTRPGRVPANGLAAWLHRLLERRPRKLAAVALANKMARIAWAMLARGDAYRPQPVSV